MLVATSAQTRASLARGSGSIHVFKGHYKSDKPDGVIPREEAEVRHYAMETSISGGIVATIRFSLFPYLPHTAWVRAADVTRAKNIRAESRMWKKSVQFRVQRLDRGNVTSVLQDASPTRFDAGIVSNAFRRDCKYRRPSLFLPTPGCAFEPVSLLPILDQLISSAYVRAKLFSRPSSVQGVHGYSKLQEIIHLRINPFYLEINSRVHSMFDLDFLKHK